MPTAVDPFVSRLLALLVPLGAVEQRAMFGGHGLYLDGRFFAIVHHGSVYFRVDESSVAEFEAGGGKPFRYRRRGKPVTIASYREPPAASLTRGESLLPWARRGLEAARRRGTTAKRRHGRTAWVEQ